ncbi:methyltransferase domain-containing protein [Kribbella sp. NPDC002412]
MLMGWVGTTLCGSWMRGGGWGELEVKCLILELLDVQVGMRVLDVGLGTGVDAVEIAEMVGVGGRVVGLDVSAAMVAEARRRVAGSGLAVEVVEGDAGGSRSGTRRSIGAGRSGC